MIARALVALILLAAVARADDAVVEPSTGHSFPALRTVEGRPFILLGTGVRKKFIVKVYAMGLYLDDSEARRAFPALVARSGGGAHSQLVADDHAAQFVAFGNFSKVGVLHFVRGVNAEKIRAAFEEGLTEELAEKAPAEIKQAAQAFIALFDRDVKEDEEIVIRSGPDGRVDVTQGATKKSGPQNPKLARAVWNIWLGPKSIAPDMRRTLVDRIEILGR